MVRGTVGPDCMNYTVHWSSPVRSTSVLVQSSLVRLARLDWSGPVILCILVAALPVECKADIVHCSHTCCWVNASSATWLWWRLQHCHPTAKATQLATSKLNGSAERGLQCDHVML